MSEKPTSSDYEQQWEEQMTTQSDGSETPIRRQWTMPKRTCRCGEQMTLLVKHSLDQIGVYLCCGKCSRKRNIRWPFVAALASYKAFAALGFKVADE